MIRLKELRHQCEGEDEDRECLDHVHQAQRHLADRLSGSARPSGEYPEGDADQHREQRRDEGDIDVDPRGCDHA
jgi:hypothetical protein